MNKSQKKLGEWGFESKPRVEKKRFPVKSLCFFCGKTRWLNWDISGKPVCDNCKNMK